MIGDLQNTIWLRPATLPLTSPHARMVLFRLEFTLSSPALSCTFHISAADRYRLYVNGKSVVCGPRKGDQWSHYYETVDIAPYLREGFNALSVRVVAFPLKAVNESEHAPFSQYAAGLGNLLMVDAQLGTKDGLTSDLSTGQADWRCALDPSYSVSGNTYVYGTEVFDAPSALPFRENKPLDLPKAVPAFDTEINKYGELSPILLTKRMIPNMEEIPGEFAREMPLHPEDTPCTFTNGEAVIPAHTKQVIELDAGVERTAYLSLIGKGRGGKVTIYYAERYFPRDENAPTGSMKRDDWENGYLGSRRSGTDFMTGLHDILTLSENEAVFENFWFRTFRFVRIEVVSGDEPVILQKPTYLMTAYPLDVKAKFDFPEEKWDRLWNIAVRTLRNCMHETHEDCPYYEQLQYTFDTRLQMLFTYAISADTRMAKNVLWDFHSSQLPDGILQSRTPCFFTQVIPDFSISWVYMLKEYAEQTGDLSVISRYKPTMDGIFHFYQSHINENGLVENLGYWEFADWLDEWPVGIPNATALGASAVHNLTYALGLRTAAEMMRKIKRFEEAAFYDRQADEIGEAVVKFCYEEDRGVLREGPTCYEHSQHAQVLATLCGALTGEKAVNAMRRAMEDPDMLQCTFPWHTILFRALDKVGLYDLSAPIWEQYLSMLDRNLTTIPEKPGDTRSDCHAWSALPLYEFPRMLLGVQMDAYGWESIKIEPHAINMDHLSGTVPTPKGDVSVSWHLEGEKMHIKVSAPDVPVTVHINGNTYEADHGEFEL